MKIKNKIFKVTIYDGGFCWKNPRVETVEVKLKFKDLAFPIAVIIAMVTVYAIT